MGVFDINRHIADNFRNIAFNRNSGGIYRKFSCCCI